MLMRYHKRFSLVRVLLIVLLLGIAQGSFAAKPDQLEKTTAVVDSLKAVAVGNAIKAVGLSDIDNELPDSDYGLTKTVFVELHLSPEGVFGVDSSANEWEYDFSRECFVNEELATRPKGTAVTYNRDRAQRDIDRVIEKSKKLEKTFEELGLDKDILKRRLKGLQLGSIEVKEDEIVTGPLVAVGEVTVKGIVDDDVISYTRITVTSTGIINGDARAPDIVKMRGGQILGDRYETEMPKIPEIDLFNVSSYTALVVHLIIFVVFLFCALLALAIIPKPIKRLYVCVKMSFVKSFFIGFGFWFALGPLLGLLCLTIIGIPIAIFIFPIALVLGIVIGILGVSQFTGEKVEKYIGGDYRSQLKRVILGLTIIYVPWLIASLFMINSSGASEGFAIAFNVIAIVLWSVVVSTGVGAVILTRFGSRDCTRAKSYATTDETSPIIPPPPSPPPLKSDDDKMGNET